MNFYKDGSGVGSIGNNSTNLTINGVGALELQEGGTTRAYVESTGIHPWVNNTYDLGTSGSNWKDLYLSGGVYLGGVGASNQLDDYEEGTWTPAVRGAGTAGTYTYTGFASYTKVGRSVTVCASLSAITESSAGTGYLTITGLPFAKKANSMSTGAVDFRELELGSSNTGCVVEFITSASTSVVYLRGTADNFSGADVQIGGIYSGLTFIGFSMTYETT